MFFAARFAGARGAAASWMFMNVCFVLFVIPMVHKSLLSRADQRAWYLTDVGMPLFTALAVAGVFRLIVPNTMSLLATFGTLALVSASTLAAGILATPTTRERAFSLLGRAAPRPLHAL
jgi:hypothetical protein